MNMKKVIPKFWGRLKGGVITFDNREQFDKYLKTLKDSIISIVVQKARKTRSEKQNSYYWVYLTIICDETGELEPMYLHEMFKRAFLSYTIPFNGKEYQVTGSTAKLDTGQFTKYIEKIEQLTGIPAPDPNDYYVI